MSKLGDALEAMDKATPELKPCPFCGDRDHLQMTRTYNGMPWFTVFCMVCKTHGGSRLNELAARESWNTRTNDDALPWIKEALPWLEWVRREIRTQEDYRLKEKLAALDALIAQAKPRRAK